MIQPIFTAKFVAKSMEIFQKHGAHLTQALEQHLNKPDFNIIHLLHNCYGDVISGKLNFIIFY